MTIAQHLHRHIGSISIFRTHLKKGKAIVEPIVIDVFLPKSESQSRQHIFPVSHFDITWHICVSSEIIWKQVLGVSATSAIWRFPYGAKLSCCGANGSAYGASSMSDFVENANVNYNCMLMNNGFGWYYFECINARHNLYRQQFLKKLVNFRMRRG